MDIDSVPIPISPLDVLLKSIELVETASVYLLVILDSCGKRPVDT